MYIMELCTGLMFNTISLGVPTLPGHNSIIPQLYTKAAHTVLDRVHINPNLQACPLCMSTMIEIDRGSAVGLFTPRDGWESAISFNILQTVGEISLVRFKATFWTDSWGLYRISVVRHLHMYSGNLYQASLPSDQAQRHGLLGQG